MGEAESGEKVTVYFQEQCVSVTADAEGRWLLRLDPRPASAKPARMLAQGTNTVEINNVLVGEVWLRSGQSNMEWPVRAAANPAREAAAANHPLIRHFKVQRNASARPTRVLRGEWEICSPETVGTFSAVAYYFGRELYKELNVPVGLINSSWGGTQIEPWMSAKALSTDPTWPAVLNRWHDEMRKLPEKQAEYEKKLAAWKPPAPKPRPPMGAGSPRQPAALYNGMIHPLIPAAIRGVIWYQGESNEGRAAEYRTLFSSLIRQWREDFGQGGIPFYHVQLANIERPRDPSRVWWAWLRDAQMQALRLPNTGQAVAIDIGETDNIHPKNKQEAGRRLALIALANIHGKSCEFSGPVFENMTTEDSSLRLNFTHATGLNSKDKTIQGFEVAGGDRVFHLANARIDGETIVVSARRVKNPVALRYAWRNDPPCPLYNAAGLPASPFRSDDWE
jgi:sialate O-acetylesterase